MLSSAGLPGDAGHRRDLGIEFFLNKPVKRTDLLSALLRACGAPAARRGSPGAGRPAEGRPAPLRLLLAEDGVINQRVAVSLLEKRGHSVVVAGNGREALAVAQEQSFDVILMDVQMPEMDGFETTAALRRLEADTGRHTPIIAMTAHAMKGDRERCLKAGMDGYLSKPFVSTELYAAVESLGRGLPAAKAAVPEPAPRVVNWDEALVRVDGNEELLAALGRMLLEEGPRLLIAIRSAAEQHDAPGLRRAAHTLKGSAGIFGAEAVVEAALQLEQMGTQGKSTDVRPALDKLDVQLGGLLKAVAARVEMTPART
jgi:CheY-like chemotaxis protein/HPt (histidine-containing phosphotransfer) domain-containing protein